MSPRSSASVIALCLALLGLQGCATLGKAAANLPASFGDYAVTRDIAYGAADRQRLDVYQPADPEPVEEPNATDIDRSPVARPIVVFLHGGGWRSGKKDAYKFVADSLTARGFVVIAPGYRLFPEVRFPDFVMDAAQAVVWAERHGAEFGGNPQQIFIMGHSAGAHIGALVALDGSYLQRAGGTSNAIAGFIGLAGPYEYLPFPTGIFGPPEQYSNAQPINFVMRDSPPLLLLHGESDRIVWVSNTERMAARVRNVGGRVEERYYQGMSHGGIISAFSRFFRSRRTVLDDVDRFIRSNTPAASASTP